jgi:hypothetical protein
LRSQFDFVFCYGQVPTTGKGKEYGSKRELAAPLVYEYHSERRRHVLWDCRFGNNIEIKKSPRKGEALMNQCSHPTNWTTRAIFILVSLAMILWSENIVAQSLRLRDEVSRIITIEKITVKDGTVSGEVHNLSPNTLRDAQLYIRYIWIWDNEFHPGKNDPSTSFVYTLPQEIAPAGRVAFTYSPSPPLPNASGGYFMTEVALAGFTEVIPAKQ